jgi:hypothetical protein
MLVNIVPAFFIVIPAPSAERPVLNNLRPSGAAGIQWPLDTRLRGCDEIKGVSVDCP